MANAPDAKGLDALKFFKGISKAKQDDKHDAMTKAQPYHEITEIAKSSDYYNMNHYKRGVAIIFNHYEFDDYRLNRRDGTIKDGADLKDLLQELKFDVTLYTDLKYGAIYEVITALANADHSQSDCLIIAVLSHGEKGKVHAKDHQYPPDTLWNAFSGDKCTTLAGKPKLFFIQACRGTDVDDGTSVKSDMIEHDASMSSTYTIPAMADILVMYSTYDGYFSWRSPVTGSWFIQSLCSELKKYVRDRDVQTILAFVNRKMAIGYQSNVPNSDKLHAKKQIGTIVSTFTRLLHFYPPQQ